MADPITIAVVLKQIATYIAAQLAYKKGVEPLLEKWKKSRSDPELLKSLGAEEEAAKLKAEHDKLQQKLSQYKIAADHQLSALNPLLTELVQHTKTREQHTKLVELLKELVGRISSERIEKRLDRAYDDLDAAQLESRRYRYELPEGWYDDHYVFAYWISEDHGGPYNPPGFYDVNYSYSDGSTLKLFQPDRGFSHDIRTETIIIYRNGFVCTRRPGIFRKEKWVTFGYQLAKVSVENRRLAHDLEEFFNDPDLSEHHPENTEGVVRKTETDFFSSLKTFYENQRSAREYLKNLIENLYDMDILKAIAGDTELETTGVLDSIKFFDEWLKKCEKLTKKFNEMQSLMSTWRKTTSRLFANDTISDKLRSVGIKEVISADHFLRFFEAVIDDQCIHYYQRNRDDLFKFYPKFLADVAKDSQPLLNIASRLGKDLSEFVPQKKCSYAEHQFYIRISEFAEDIDEFGDSKAGMNYEEVNISTVDGDYWPVSAINTGMAFNILKCICDNTERQTIISRQRLAKAVSQENYSRSHRFKNVIAGPIIVGVEMLPPERPLKIPFDLEVSIEKQKNVNGEISFLGDDGISLPNSLLNRRSSDRLYHAFRRGEQSLEPLKRVLLKPRKERIDKLREDLGVTDQQIEKLMDRIRLLYTANCRSWETVKEAVDEWYSKAFNEWYLKAATLCSWKSAEEISAEQRERAPCDLSDKSNELVLKEAFDEWSRESEFPPLWVINTPFGYKSPKQITEEGLEDLCAPLFKNQTDHWETVTLSSNQETLRIHQEHLTIAQCDEAIRLNPEDINAYNNRGNAKFRLGQYKEAIADYDMALRINPKDANAYNNRKECQKKVVAELSDDFLRALKRS